MLRKGQSVNSFKQKTGVVLSGGGAKGAYEAGALKSIVKKAKSIQVMTGASIGAINAAIFAWEYQRTGDLIKATDLLQRTWLELGDLFEINIWRIIGHAILSQLYTGSPLNFPSLVDNKKIKTKLKELIPENIKISDIECLDLAINATSLSKGKTVSFTRDNDAYLLEAVLASSSLPLIFESQRIENNFYVDGGVFNNTPLKDALEAGATEVIVVELKPEDTELYMETIQDSSDFTGVYKVGTRLVELIMDKTMYEDLKQAKRINEIIDVIFALQAAGEHKLVRRLKESIGYEKHGKIKRHINFYEIAPSKRLDPPGTMGFANKKAIRAIMELGAKDAERKLAHVTFHERRRVS